MYRSYVSFVRAHPKWEGVMGGSNATDLEGGVGRGGEGGGRIGRPRRRGGEEGWRLKDLPTL